MIYVAISLIRPTYSRQDNTNTYLNDVIERNMNAGLYCIIIWPS